MNCEHRFCHRVFNLIISVLRGFEWEGEKKLASISRVLIICGLDAFRKVSVFSCSVNEKYIRSYCHTYTYVSSHCSSIHLHVRLKTDMSPSKARSMRQTSSERHKLFDRRAIIISFYHNLNK